MNPWSVMPKAFALALGSFLLTNSLHASDLAPAQGGANSAKNLARLNCGAHIERILPGGRVDTFGGTGGPIGDSSALVLDDDTLSCPLAVGDNTFVITLPRISVLQRFAFVDRNAVAQGEFELAVSNYRLGSSDSSWKTVVRPTSFGKDSVITAPMLGVEARYVRLTFHVKKEGHLSALSLYGTPTLQGFARVNTFKAQTGYSFGAMTLVRHLEDTLNFNYANQYASGRIVYVSSTGANSPLCMIDDDATTSFSFLPDDPHPTVIIALSNREMLHRVSALTGMPDGRVDIYLLDELSTDPADLSRGRLIGSVTGHSADGKVALDFNSQKARYVAFRWTPEKKSNHGVTIAEIGIFGTVPMAIVNLTEDPNLFAELSRPGEGSQDFSNSLGTLANPPTVAPVSP